MRLSCKASATHEQRMLPVHVCSIALSRRTEAFLPGRTYRVVNVAQAQASEWFITRTPLVHLLLRSSVPVEAARREDGLDVENSQRGGMTRRAFVGTMAAGGVISATTAIASAPSVSAGHGGRRVRVRDLPITVERLL